MDIQKNALFRVGLLIPVFNVEKTIARVLKSIHESEFDEIQEILIIDNHSTDDTVSIIQKYLIKHPYLLSRVTLVLHAQNYGYGSSVKAGFAYFCDRSVTHVMLIHGDHQVEPAWLVGQFLSTLHQEPSLDLVLASRFKTESDISGYSALRKFGNYFFNITTRFCSGHRMSDSGTAMIVVRPGLLKKVPFKNLSNSWQFHPQLNILFYGIPGVKIEEIPMNWSDSDAASTVPLVRYGLILLKMLVLYWFKKNILRKNQEQLFPADPLPLDRSFEIIHGALPGGVSAVNDFSRLNKI